MRRSPVVGLVAMFFAAASCATALAQATKQTAPGAVTSASTAVPNSGGATQGAPHKLGTMSFEAGVTKSNTANLSEKGHNN
jgi:hypothetical protein